MASVSFEHVEKHYPGGTCALADLSLAVGDGELLVVVGPSGSGKSTLLRVLAGLEPVTRGTLRIGGCVVNELAPQQRNVAMVFQDYALYPHMSVRRNLEFPLRMRGLARDEMRRRVGRVAELLEIGALLERRPAELSGGQRQRAAMGRALVREPTAFLLDEPLSNLDARLRAAVRAEIGELQRQLRTTMIYVTHDQLEAMTLAQRVAVLHQGSLQQLAPPRELYENPANTFVAGFIGSPPMNLFASRLVLEGGQAKLALGDQLVPIGAGPAAQTRCGEPLTGGVRPEALALASDAAPGSLAARVEHVENLGHETLAHVSVSAPAQPEGRLALVARLPGRPELVVGDALRLRVDPQRVHLFDASGRSLGS
jgi:multiple sugar transport system ATP-binding protein